ncbi:MAG: YigZ family protein [Bacteroidales bacterium]|nr:YigZ family protein [Bacteroidales bacterium]
MFDYTYKTIEKESEGIYREKGSKFIALAFPVKNEDAVKERLSEVKKKYYDARHHCYAYILGPNKDSYRLNDDGEPSGTAGRPIHGQLLSKDVTDTLIIVVRYFGGIKLGVSGLLNAYKTAAKDALENSHIITKFVEEQYGISFPPVAMNKVMQLLKRDSVKIMDQQYNTECEIYFSIQKREADVLLESLKKIENLKLSVWNP